MPLFPAAKNNHGPCKDLTASNRFQGGYAMEKAAFNHASMRVHARAFASGL